MHFPLANRSWTRISLLYSLLLGLLLLPWASRAADAPANAAPAPTPAPAPASHLTLFMAGDSTMATQALVPPTPARGWGQMLQPYFSSEVKVDNHAASGHSTKSFRDSGKWKKILDLLQPGDYVLIQFGHNDSKPDAARHTEPFGTFHDNLKQFVLDVREHHGNPLLATSVVRNVFNSDGTMRDTHGDYVKAARQVAEELQVPLLELNKKSEALVLKLGPERSKSLFNNVEPGDYARYPEGFKDGTHFNVSGAARICDLAVEEIIAKVPDLAKHIPQAQMRVMHYTRGTNEDSGRDTPKGEKVGK